MSEVPIVPFPRCDQFRYFAHGEQMVVPKGTLAEARRVVGRTLTALGLETEVYLGARRLCRRAKGDGTFYHSDEPGPSVTDEVFCDTVAEHMRWYHSFYQLMAKLHKEPLTEGEVMTEADASDFWHGLHAIRVPVERWTTEYFKNRMTEMYEIMRGRSTEGYHVKAFTPQQASTVIWLVTEFLGIHKDDVDPEVPFEIGQRGRLTQLDELVFRDDYEYCDSGNGFKGCGPITNPRACRKKKCPLRHEEDDDA